MTHPKRTGDYMVRFLPTHRTPHFELRLVVAGNWRRQSGSKHYSDRYHIFPVSSQARQYMEMVTTDLNKGYALKDWGAIARQPAYRLWLGATREQTLLIMGALEHAVNTWNSGYSPEFTRR
jgi:hypothetical protein